MSATVDSRKSLEVHGGGRGGAGNVGAGSGHDYVDGGLYRSDTPGADGRPYSTGRGGYGNISEGTPRDSMSGSEARDHYAHESVMSHKDGAQESGGRGGAGNIGNVTSQDKLDDSNTPKHSNNPIDTEELAYGVEHNPRLEKRRLSSGMSHLGLADRMKFGILSMMKKD